jgi:hypothetical protein
MFKVACPRCGGSGHFSRNSYGSTVCYECNGAKTVLRKTKPRPPAPFFGIFAVCTSQANTQNVALGETRRVHGFSARSPEKAMEKFRAFLAHARASRGGAPFWDSWDLVHAFAQETKPNT